MLAGEFTALMARSRDGDASAHELLFRLVYAELRRIARRQLGGRRRGHTLDTTGLVHESYIRLVGPAAGHVQTRAHFLNLAARAMRQILCDHARRRMAEWQARDPRDPVELDAGERVQAEQWLRLDEALHALAGENPRAARVVECRFFAGLSEEETGAALHASLRTVQREWNRAREWLRTNMSEA